MGWWANRKEKKRLKREFDVQQQEAKLRLLEDQRLAAEAPRLHGYNLNEWNYLGFTEISISYTDIKGYKEVAQVFFFMHKDDESKRQYVVKSKALNKEFKNHAWVARNADLWAAGELKWYQPISDSPSNYTQDRILREFKSVWSTEKNWWVSNDAAKYRAAKIEQDEEEQEEDKVVSVDENVVTVNFKREDETT